MLDVLKKATAFFTCINLTDTAQEYSKRHTLCHLVLALCGSLLSHKNVMIHTAEGLTWFVTVAVVGAGLSLLQSLVSRCLFYTQQFVFTHFAQVWDISEHHLHQVTNIATIARLVGEAGMHSYISHGTTTQMREQMTL